MSAQDPPPPPLLAPAAALLQRLAPYGLTVPQAWLQPRIVLLDVGARTSSRPTSFRELGVQCAAAAPGAVRAHRAAGLAAAAHCAAGCGCAPRLPPSFL